ncbi:MAG: glucose-1-phosphate cytidylyltransferase [Candidatus Puniceispirillaceae bacterium]
MKVVILAGGFGTRLGEFTDVIPKPMVQIGNKPIIWHIMKNFSSFGLKDFYVALGYKADVIKSYFSSYASMKSDFCVDLGTGIITPIGDPMDGVDWRVRMVETGEQTMTGGRLKRLKAFLSEGPFILTYGDGLSNVDIQKLVAFHRSHGKLVTITAVRPAARFGELDLVDDQVTAFQEKPQTRDGWINGGFFVMEPGFLDYLDSDETVLEAEPLKKLSAAGELMAFKHDGFWQCMDTKRDKDLLEKMLVSGKAPWQTFE